MSVATRRLLQVKELRIASEGEKRTIVGYAAVYDQLSEDLGGFVEMIRKGAFTESLAQDDIRCLWNHDANHVLGRNKAGTLRLSEDLRGLRIECDLPDTQAGRDVAIGIERGDIAHMSFGFETIERRWTFRKPPEADLRELMKVRLFDVSPVTFPAYPQTEVGMRASGEDLDEYRSAKAAHEAGMRMRERELELLEAEG